MKLKTLKDFDDMGDIILNIKNLKAEAVKWVKDLEGGKIDAEGIKEYEIADKCEAIIGFIINFFNLTEEDLGEQK